MATVGIVSFRLGGGDGVSVEAAKWARALGRSGHRVHTVAGSGRADVVVPGLGLPDPVGGCPPEPPTAAEVDAALAPCDVVVVENLCSLPLNPPAAAVVAAALRGRPAVLRHHDLAWQRPHLAHLGPPPHDPAWRHVTINELSREQLAAHGIEATTVYNHFEPAPPAGRRAVTRAALGVGDGEALVLQPTRALPRKNVGAAMDLCARIGAVYWLLGPPEDGYGPELERLVAAARCRVLRGAPPEVAGFSVADAYAACDLVALPSTWEGFGNPTVESAVHRRALVVGPYPVARELAGAFGFEWFWLGRRPGGGVGEALVAQVSSWLRRPRASLVDHNHAMASRHLNLQDLPQQLELLMQGFGCR